MKKDFAVFMLVRLGDILSTYYAYHIANDGYIQEGNPLSAGLMNSMSYRSFAFLNLALSIVAFYILYKYTSKLALKSVVWIFAIFTVSNTMIGLWTQFGVPYFAGL